MTKQLFIGLGNPGREYNKTRHNLGIDTLRLLISDDSLWQEDTRLGIAQVAVEQATFIFPLTGMNESGRAVATYLKNNPVDLENILIIHDDLELPLGEVKRVETGSAKGHNGVKSIQENLSSQDIPRLRMGIGRPAPEQDVSDFVLSKFLPEEKEVVEEMKREALASIIS